MENENLPKYDKHDSTNKNGNCWFCEEQIVNVYKKKIPSIIFNIVISDEGKVSKYEKGSVSNIASNY